MEHFGLLWVSTLLSWTIYKVFLWLHSRLTTDVHKLRRVTGGHWLWGHELELWQRPCGEFITEHSNDMGFTYTIKGALFHPDIIVSMDPLAVAHAFTRNGYNYEKSPSFHSTIARQFGKGLGWAEGAEHKRQRKMLMPIFSPEAVRGMQDSIQVAADKLVASLQTHLQSSPTSCVDVIRWTNRASLDVIGAVSFGWDFQCGQSPGARDILDARRKSSNVGLTRAGFIAPTVFRAFPLLTNLPIPAFRAQSAIKQSAQKIGERIIEDRRKIGDDSLLGRNDLLSVLMRMNRDVDEQALLDHIATFMGAGIETVALTINWALHELSKNKHMQDKLRHEVLGSQGRHSSDELQQVSYLDAFCKETLRLYPAVSYIERVAIADDAIPLRYPVIAQSGEQLSSIRIKKGQMLHFSAVALNRLAWGENAHEFLPERWLDPALLSDPSITIPGWNGLFSFIDGPHMCIAYRLAWLEMKIILSTLIRSFEFTDTGKKIVAMHAVLTQPVVVGDEQAGGQLPINIKVLG